MEISGKIKKIFDTQTFSNGFRKRKLVIITDNIYPQHILVVFLSKQIYLLDNLKINDYIKVYINIIGKEWINSEGVIIYYNYIQGWRIEKIKNKELTYFRKINSLSVYDDFYDLPF